MGEKAVSLRRLFVEGLAIVASILVAFAIDSSWQEYQEQQRQEASLQALRDDFVGAYHYLAATIDYHRESEAGLVRLLQLTSDRDIPWTDAEVVRLVRATATIVSYVHPTGTIDSLVGSGDLYLLDDTQLRSALVAYQTSLDSLYRTQAWGLGFIHDVLTEYLGSNVPTLVFGWQGPAPGAPGDDIPAPYTDGEIHDYAIGLLGSMRFQNIVHRRLVLTRLLIVKVEELRQRSQEICVMLGGQPCSANTGQS